MEKGQVVMEQRITENGSFEIFKTASMDFLSQKGMGIWHKRCAYVHYCLYHELSRFGWDPREWLSRGNGLIGHGDKVADESSHLVLTDGPEKPKKSHRAWNERRNRQDALTDVEINPGWSLQTWGESVWGDSFRASINNQFRDSVSDEIKWKEFDWKEDEKRIQHSLYFSACDGIVIFKNTPKIPSKFNIGKKAFYGFDSEDNGFGFPHFYQFAWDEGVAISHSFRLLFRWASKEFNLADDNHITWITNIAYDYGNIMKDWDLNAWSSEDIWRKGTLLKFACKHDPEKDGWGETDGPKRQMVFWDTMNHWKLSVSDMGTKLTDIFGYDFNKLEKDFYSFKYAAMDAIVSRAYAAVQNSGYAARNIDLRLTPGSTALHTYVKGTDKDGNAFCRSKIYKTHEDSELDYIYPALRGGRTEVFSLKKYEGEIHYLDFNSAYPYCMKFYKNWPVLNSKFFTDSDKKIRSYLKSYEGIADCTVDATEVDAFVKHIPYLGTIEETNKRFVFPLGKWRAKYTFFEIRRAMELGYKFFFHDAMVYKRMNESPFELFVDMAYGMRLEGDAKGDPVLKEIGKSLANNLYGKWGQRMSEEKKVHIDDIEDVISELDTEELNSIKLEGNFYLMAKDKGYASHTNVIWSAYTTALCRDHLYKAIVNAAELGNEIIYCDTDSIFCVGGKLPANNARELGALKLEKTYDMFQAFLPKTYMYAYRNKKGYKAKGVPADQRQSFIETGMAEYKKPLRFKESLNRQNVPDAEGVQGSIGIVNAWITVKKELKGEYTKRKVNPDKSTSPLVLG